MNVQILLVMETITTLVKKSVGGIFPSSELSVDNYKTCIFYDETDRRTCLCNKCERMYFPVLTDLELFPDGQIEAASILCNHLFSTWTIIEKGKAPTVIIVFSNKVENPYGHVVAIQNGEWHLEGIDTVFCEDVNNALHHIFTEM